MKAIITAMKTRNSRLRSSSRCEISVPSVSDSDSSLMTFRCGRLLWNCLLWGCLVRDYLIRDCLARDCLGTALRRRARLHVRAFHRGFAR